MQHDASREALDPARRDYGLDALRVLALTLMVAIHYFQRLPTASPLIEGLKFVGESSAPIFFAFGLTYQRHRAKPTLEKVHANLLLLCVALAHNLFLWGKLATVDFLCFLVLWRVFLDAISSLRRDHWVWLGLCGATSAVALGFPRAGVIDGAFMSVTHGLFPLLPWGVLVLLGAAYARWNPSRAQAWLAGSGAVALALLLWWLGQGSARTSLALSKWPLTTPYILLFTGACILFVEVVRLGQTALARRPRVVAPLVFVSSHLLLGAVLQYLPLELLYWLTPKLAVLQPAQNDGAAVLTAIVVGSGACLALFYLLLPLTVRLWDRSASLPRLEALRRHRYLTALALLSVAAILCSAPIEQALATPSFPRPGKPVAALAMLWLALELGEWQRRGRGAAQPR